LSGITFFRSRYPSIASIPPCLRHVQLSPDSDTRADVDFRQLRANRCHMRRSTFSAFPLKADIKADIVFVRSVPKPAVSRRNKFLKR
jgi:hypothetical protein